jgi:hypothetical protein
MSELSYLPVRRVEDGQNDLLSMSVFHHCTADEVKTRRKIFFLFDAFAHRTSLNIKDNLIITFSAKCRIE